MTADKKRLRFVLILSSLATIYGGILAYRLLNFQADVASDIMKICGLVFICTLGLSFFWWSIITPKYTGPKGGVIAALLTCICIIPAPTFAGAFKGEFLTNHSLISAVQAGLKYSLATFSAAEAFALPLCGIAGYMLAK